MFLKPAILLALVCLAAARAPAIGGPTLQPRAVPESTVPTANRATQQVQQTVSGLHGRNVNADEELVGSAASSATGAAGNAGGNVGSGATGAAGNAERVGSNSAATAENFAGGLEDESGWREFIHRHSGGRLPGNAGGSVGSGATGVAGISDPGDIAPGIVDLWSHALDDERDNVVDGLGGNPGRNLQNVGSGNTGFRVPGNAGNLPTNNRGGNGLLGGLRPRVTERHNTSQRRAMEATTKRFHAHNRRQRSRVFPKRDAPSDIDILNFALTLEHLVSAFYEYGLDKHSLRVFRKAGYEGWTRRRYSQIAKNSRTHVQFLESALGDKAVKACRYYLKDEDVGDWIVKSFVVENVVTSAWNGFVGILQDRAYQTVAASIMGVKARHAAWINSVVRNSNAWNTAFETPLDMNQIYSLISPFIIPGSCPSTNAPLRATLFPTLHVPPCHPGSVITLEYESPAKVKDAPLFAAFVSGTGTVFVSMGEEKKVEVPKGLVGIVYVFVTRDGGKVGTDGIVAGPGVVWFGFKA